jgi:SOS-response transcriptional repressor LexA
MSLAKRLKSAREKAKLSQRALSQKTGLSQQLISKLETGAVDSTTEIFPLAEALAVDPRWLATGEESGNSASTGEQAVCTYVPLISWVAAGSWREFPDMSPNDGDAPHIPVTRRVSSRAYALRINGDSMEPGFPNGGIIVVDPDVQPRPGSYVVVRLDDSQQATFKQLVVDGGEQYLKPLNPRYPIMPVRERASFCGVVKQLVMDIE